MIYIYIYKLFQNVVPKTIQEKKIKIFGVAGLESPPEKASSSAVGPSTSSSTSTKASNNADLTVSQNDICSLLEDEVGFKLKHAINEKSFGLGLSSEQNIRDLYGRYYELKTPEEKTII